jgi:hypothetical protein
MTNRKNALPNEGPGWMDNNSVESRKVVPTPFWQSLAKSYPLWSQLMRYDLLQQAEMKPGRRAYATARTNDHISNTPGDQRTERCWAERHTNCRGSRMFRVDRTQVATTSAKAWTPRLNVADGTSGHWSVEYFSAGITADHPPSTHAPSRLGTSHPFSCTQDGCLLARSASPESSTTSQAPQTSRLDAPLSAPSGPDPTASNLTN